jgi:multisubunit Na+/H+ antiporter MnhF subunit
MNVWLIGATVLLGALVPCGVVILRAQVLDALVALTLAGTVTALALLLIAEGFHRNSYYTLPLVLAFTNFVGVMIFVRFFGHREL